jgi:hypothetical protein
VSLTQTVQHSSLMKGNVCCLQSQELAAGTCSCSMGHAGLTLPTDLVKGAGAEQTVLCETEAAAVSSSLT